VNNMPASPHEACRYDSEIPSCDELTL